MDPDKRRALWDTIDPDNRALAVEYINGGPGRILSRRYETAIRLGYMTPTKETIGIPRDQFGQYIVNADREEVKIILGDSDVDKRDYKDARFQPQLIEHIIESPQVTDKIYEFYANFLGKIDTSERVESVRQDTELVRQGLTGAVNSLAEETLFPPDSGPPVSSTQLITTNGVQYLNQFNQSWFLQNIPNAHSLHYTRQTMLEQTKNQILTKFNNNKWISSESTQVTDIIMDYIAEQYDLAAEEMSQ